MAKGKTSTPTQVAATKQTEKVVAPAQQVKHPEIKVEVCKGENAITVERAKALLGWESEPDYIAKLKLTDANLNEDLAKEIFGKDFFLVDILGNRVKLHNNTRNRPWGAEVSKTYMQDMLQRHWEFNGETVIIGKYGRVLSAQHRLIGLVFAEQTRTLEGQAEHWAEYWKTPVVMEGIIVYGVDESPKVTRTIDNVKSRTLSDVIFADTEMFGSLNSVQRKTAGRYMDYAVKFLWERMGEKGNKWAPKRTHSESLDFVDRHPKLKDAIKHILEEEKDGRLSRYVYPGHAAALLYMMSTTGTPEQSLDDYHVGKLTTPSTEKGLKFDNTKKAKMFWSDIARNDPSVKGLIEATCPLPGDTSETGFRGQVFERSINGNPVTGDGTPDVVIGTIIRAWNLYVADQPITQEGIELTYVTRKDDNGVLIYVLAENPSIAHSVDVGKSVPAAVQAAVKAANAPESAETPSGLEELTDAEGDEIAEAAQSGEPTIPKTVHQDNAIRKMYDADKAAYTGHILVYPSPVANSDNLMVYFDDAELFGPLVGTKPRPHPMTGVTGCVLNQKEFEEGAAKAMEMGHNLLVFSRPDKNGKRVATPYALAETNDGQEPTEVVAEAPAPEAPKPRMVIKRK